MAYEAKRKKLYEEEFLLTEEDGTVVHTLHVSLDADNMVKKLSAKHVALSNAMQDVQKISDKADEQKLETLGNAVVDICEAVFGKEDTQTILEFYDSRYIEMCQEVMPFIVEIVIPQVRRIAKENKKQTMKKYSKNWRPFFRMR